MVAGGGEITPDQVRGMLYGLAVGDALGVPYEFKSRGTFRCDGMAGHGTHDRPAGTWSDDRKMETCPALQRWGLARDAWRTTARKRSQCHDTTS